MSDLFERPQLGERAILVHIDQPGQKDVQALAEFHELALAAGAQPLATITAARRAPDPKFYVGTGKADEIKQAVLTYDAGLILFNHTLTPAQERNLEKLLRCRVLDRIGLILDIFAQRARTFEGKLQVELAQLQHLSTRLVRGWTHLERQRGGIGLRGPGETQLETDRRLIRARIKSINKRLEKVRKQRGQGRHARRKIPVPTVSLVGYTNAGKSTLFNYLTSSDVYAADQLFATLDPTLRRIELEEIGRVILADTVGFIRDLPHDLVNAFHATLEETENATLLMHIVDAHSLDHKQNIEDVEAVLAEINADDVPQLQVYNKIDLLSDVEPRIDRDEEGRPVRVWCSAQTGAGVELLREALNELLAVDMVVRDVTLTSSQGKLRADIYEYGMVTHEKQNEDGTLTLSIRMARRHYDRLF